MNNSNDDIPVPADTPEGVWVRRELEVAEAAVRELGHLRGAVGDYFIALARHNDYGGRALAYLREVYEGES